MSRFLLLCTASLLGLWVLLSLRGAPLELPLQADLPRILSACQTHLKAQGLSGSVILPTPSLVPSGYASRLTTASQSAQQWTVTGEWSAAARTRLFTCHATEEAGQLQVTRITWP